MVGAPVAKIVMVVRPSMSPGRLLLDRLIRHPPQVFHFGRHWVDMTEPFSFSHTLEQSGQRVVWCIRAGLKTWHPGVDLGHWVTASVLPVHVE